jgi:copper chaperone CopZ
MATKTFKVEEIHCGACETSIRKALTRLDGIKEVDARAATNQVTVTYDENQVAPEAVAERLATAGYPVTR